MATHIYKDGKLVKVSNYDTSLMMTMTNIFPNNSVIAKDFLRKKEGVEGKLRDIYSTKDNSALCRKIFRVFIKEVILDIVQGNCMFKWPGNIQATMYVGNLNDDLVKKKRKQGNLSNFDLFSTNYKVPYIKYKFSPKSKRQELHVYISKDLYSKLVNHANSGKIFSRYPKKLSNFLPNIYECFPYIEEDGIKKLLVFCLSRMAYYLKRGEELRIIDKTGEIRFFRPLGNIHDKVMLKVKKQRITREKNKNELKDFS